MEITRDIAIKVRNVVDAGLVKGVGEPKPGQMCVEAAVCYAFGLPHGDDPGCVAASLRALKIRLNDSSWSGNQARAKGLRRLALAQLGSAELDEKEFVRRVVDYTIRTTVSRALRIAASAVKDQKHKAAMIAAAAKCEKDGDRNSAGEAKNVADADADADATSYAASYAADAASYADAAAASYAASAASYAASAADADAAASYAASSSSSAASAAASAADASYAAASSKKDEELSIFAEAIVQILIEMKAPGCQWLDLVEVV